MAKSRQSAPRLDVEIEREGERHTGTYWVEHRIITVRYSEGGSKTTQVGGTPPEILAKLLLSELVNEHRGAGKSDASRL